MKFALPLSNSPFSLVTVIRFPNVEFNQDNLSVAVQTLIRNTKYLYTAKDAQAPHLTNCVTAIRYLFLQSSTIFLPNLWIGDMPRILVRQLGCSLHTIKITSMKVGDLLFIKRVPGNTTEKTKRYISHVMISLGGSLFFHSTEDRGGACLEDFIKPKDEIPAQLLKLNIDEPYLFMRYIDPRNVNMRKKYKSEFIPFPIYRSISLKPDKIPSKL